MSEQEALAEFIGESPAIQRVREQILSLGRPDGPRPNVLVEGEAGTGKSLVAGLLHRWGRPQARVVTVNCGAVGESVLGEVLFGVSLEGSWARPWMTPGLLELVTDGTIVLEEVCGLPKALQAMLVKALGPPPPGERARADARWVISTSNINTDRALRKGYFREDLFRHLAGVRIKMPPLRECGDDVLLIANRLLPRICAQYQQPLKILAPEVGQRFLEYGWPGSVRELTHLLTEAAQLSTGPVISARALESVTSMFEEQDGIPLPRNSRAFGTRVRTKERSTTPACVCITDARIQNLCQTWFEDAAGLKEHTCSRPAGHDEVGHLSEACGATDQLKIAGERNLRQIVIECPHCREPRELGTGSIGHVAFGDGVLLTCRVCKKNFKMTRHAIGIADHLTGP